MINRTYDTIRNNVGTNIQDTSSAMETRIAVYVNDIYFDFLRRINWRAIREDYSFTATDQDHVLPTNFGKELTAYDSTNKRKLNITTIEEEVKDDIGQLGSTGTVERYAIIDRKVIQQPPTAGTLTVDSTSASDTTQTFTIRGLNQDGIEVVEDNVLTGLADVTTSNQYSYIVSVSKSAATVGTVRFTRAGTNIALMAPEMVDYNIKVVRLYATPATNITINMPYILKPLPLTNDYDVPIVDAADIIELGATMKAWQYKRQMGKAQEYKIMYEQGIQNIIWEKENSTTRYQEIGAVPYDRDNV